MKKLLPVSTLLFSALLPFAATAQTPAIPFTDETSLLPTSTFHSGNAVGVADMNGDFKDDIVRASQNTTMYIDYQAAPNAPFSESSFSNTFGAPWAMCIGDYDDNGYNDVFWGPNGPAYLLYANSNATAYTTVNLSTATGSGNIFVQGCNFFDINNDSHLDIFACDDVASPFIYLGDGTPSGWVFNQSVMPLATVPASDNSGNYASIWTDVNNDGLIDLMITHCRQFISTSTDPRRIDQIFINNGNGTWTQDTTNWTGLRDGAQGWSTAWGDIDNDGDMDAFVLNYDVNSKMQLNDGNGVFTNIMSSCGIPSTTSFFGENATFEDFDNDGFVDLLISGDKSYLYRNNGDNTFTQVTPDPFSYSGNSIRGHAVGDLNGDGFLDVYATYCNLYNTPSSKNDKLWMNDCPNNGNTNHWVFYDLVGGAQPGYSNRNGIGSIVKIYGPWGVQVREVRSGEAYGLQNSFAVHFGLGQSTTIDSTVIIWPSGIVDHLLQQNGDQHYTVYEGTSPTATHTLNSEQLSIGVYPNPAQTAATIHLDHFAAYGLNNLSLAIYDINGKQVFAQHALAQCIIPVNCTGLSSGTYFIEVRDKDKVVGTQKMIVQ